MGMVASDFYSRFTKLDIVEAPISVGELMDMASIDVQGQFAAWTAENEDTCYVPAEILTVLLEDRAFFARLTEMIDGGEYVVLSGVTLACKSVHIDRMGLTPEDARENILTFFDKSEEMTYSIESILAGTNEWVSGLYVFANGWVGIETERMMDAAWDEDEQPLGEGTPEPAASYLIDSEGELIASPDIRFDIEAWMDFVDMLNRKDGYIVFSDEVEKAMAEGRPVVVIESAATFGGMMYPGIAEFAFRMRKTVRDAGAVPAFTAILNGQIHVGLTDEEILYLEERRGSIFKASARDIPILLAKKSDGVMTIAAAVQTAAMAGIPVACGSGLESLARNKVMVVCSGTKPILDLSLTMEYLETSGVPVVGYCTDRMPEYMVRGSGFRLTYRMDTPEDLAEVMHIKDQMGIPGGVLVVNPVPKEYELDPIRTRKAVDMAMQDVKKNAQLASRIAEAICAQKKS